MPSDSWRFSLHLTVLLSVLSAQPGWSGAEVPPDQLLSEPELETERIDSVEVVLDQSLATAETKLGVEVQGPSVRDLGFKHHLRKAQGARGEA